MSDCGSFTGLCGICYEDIRGPFVRIECHEDCIDMEQFNIYKRVKDLKKKLDTDEHYYVDDFCMYNDGEEHLSEEHKKIIEDAYELKNHTGIIYDIFWSAHSDSQKAKDIFDFMMKEGMIQSTTYEKIEEGPGYAKIFDKCRGHYGENKTNRCCGWYCYDCKGSNLGMCMEGFRHCCCFKLKE